ncbi:triose-phosphate isomerase [Moraxella nonliquefaciens]|uniref:triose-phosphate isomerase n=1 Tax=Moraxella nonliquefaciens TaxID=478 RepID=UPI0024A78D6E|nr:triose-phosphate isomerase [Moraxella nonliquefaciens]MDI4497846.1 triose-phosphate isomerase [Moraxella nonliquefaciens]MDI4500833.1 triose-phosphate isomerase [Moraxella nonliquefaciens]
MSQKYVIGNWKLNPATLSDAIALATSLNNSKDQGCTVGVVPALVHLSAVKNALADGIILGVQDITHKTADTGAFTGDVSACQVAKMGAGFTLIGHSERRYHHGETEEILSAKINHALTCGLSVIYCIGESQDEHERGETFGILKNQLTVLESFAQSSTRTDSTDIAKFIIAYEPVWAIGTGLTPTPDDIEKTHRFIKDELSAFGMTAPILYGGSVNDKNAPQFAKSELIDGVLVGGASLKSEHFNAIIDAFANPSNPSK